MKYYINGVKVRTSKNIYTHAVVCGAEVLACCGSYNLAYKKMNEEIRKLAKEIVKQEVYIGRVKRGCYDDCLSVLGVNSRDELIDKAEDHLIKMRNAIIEIVELEVRA